jgi:protein TonB
MGYQALLFCPDEKLARVVSQVLSETEFAVDLVNEPFAAVKKMMAQRYDAVVVDFSDEQNTALLFKSAHNSGVNQNSLAIALVEGQAGVAKAYRIGANLVLTKPINVEQSKGTLRVARGLLKKNADSAAASNAAPVAPAKTAAAPAPVVTPSAGRVFEPVAASPLQNKVPEFVALPAMTASAKVEEEPVSAPAPVALAVAPQAVELPAAPVPLPVQTAIVETSMFERPEPAAANSAPSNVTPSSTGTAAAPAPAKESFAPAEKSEKAAEISISSKPEFSIAAEGVSDSPSFSALGGEKGDESSGSKKLVIAAVAVLALAAAAYFGWSKLGGSQPKASPQPAISEPQQQSAPMSSLAPMSVPTTIPVGTPTSQASVTTSGPGTKGSAAPTGGSPAAASLTTRIDLSPVPEAPKPAPAPIKVKSWTERVKNLVQGEESPAQLPSPLAVASASDANLNSIISSSSSAPKPVLAPVKVSQGVTQGLLIKRVQPKYPLSALASHIHGTVRIDATVDKEGKVVNPKVLSGDRTLAAAALEAVRQWRYKPYYLDGAPIEIETEIAINFAAK